VLNRIILLFLLSIVVSCSCEQDETKYSRIDIYKMVRAADPEMILVIPKSINDGVHCKDYTTGCLHGHRVRVFDLEVIFVEFKSTAHAKRAAYKYKGYYLHNWFLDDFKGEPTLERLAVNTLNAKEVTEVVKPYPEDIAKDQEKANEKSKGEADSRH
jgi:hypothetical protein